MFGEVVVKDKINLLFGKNKSIVITRRGNSIVYEGPGGKKRVVVKKISPSAKIIPAPPTGKYLSFLVVWLKDDIIIPPETSVSMWVSVPIGVKIYVDGTLVDHFNTGKIKRCLYDGFIGNNIITGCVTSSVLINRKAPKIIGGFNFVVKNSSDYPVIVKMVPLLISNTPLFYSGKVAYYPWYKVVVYNSHASVITNYTSPVENMISTRNVRLPVFETRIEVERKGENLIIGHQ